MTPPPRSLTRPVAAPSLRSALIGRLCGLWVDRRES